MAEVRLPAAANPSKHLNVADRLASLALQFPTNIAVACPQRWSPAYRVEYRGKAHTPYAVTTFAELDQDATRIAHGFARWGVQPGTRLALLIRPGIEFVTLVFALLRAGVAIILIDPGMGRRNMIRCLGEAEPEGFVAIPAAHMGRLFFRRKFPHAKWNVTVGRRWFWGGKTLDQLRALGLRGAAPYANTSSSGATGSATAPLPTTKGNDPAAIIFTSGSTGPPKGVLYTHQIFDTQVSEIQSTYAIEPGGVDLGCFPLFALFNSAMGVTTVLPEMDFSRPASADPKKLLRAAHDWLVTQAFASPAVWCVVSDYCTKTGAHIPTLREVFSCGAPVRADVQRATLACVGEGARMHTPYGATECLPVSTIEAAEVLGETAAKTDQGAGVCVGRKFDSIEWRVIRITDDPIVSIDDAEELPIGEIGELIARGPQVSPEYITSVEHTAAAKIADGDNFWHRMGDVGYLDDEGCFWYCGRKSHRVETTDGTLFTECVEAIFNQHPDVAQTALVGLGPKDCQLPVVVFQLHAEFSRRQTDMAHELRQIGQRFSHSRSIRLFTEFAILPVDVRHNSKILREELVDWVREELELTEVDEPWPSA